MILIWHIIMLSYHSCNTGRWWNIPYSIFFSVLQYLFIFLCAFSMIYYITGRSMIVVLGEPIWATMPMTPSLLFTFPGVYYGRRTHKLAKWFDYHVTIIVARLRLLLGKFCWYASTCSARVTLTKQLVHKKKL